MIIFYISRYLFYRYCYYFLNILNCYYYSDTLTVKYKGSLYESRLEFDSTEDRFGETTPFKFTLGADEVIQGWEKGMVDMCVGEK